MSPLQQGIEPRPDASPQAAPSCTLQVETQIPPVHPVFAGQGWHDLPQAVLSLAMLTQRLPELVAQFRIPPEQSQSALTHVEPGAKSRSQTRPQRPQLLLLF